MSHSRFLWRDLLFKVKSNVCIASKLWTPLCHQEYSKYIQANYVKKEHLKYDNIYLSFSIAPCLTNISPLL